MTDTVSATTTNDRAERPAAGAGGEEVADWQLAGEAWGHAAGDWATLMEPYARDAIEVIFDSVGLGAGTHLLDVACGAGYALARASRLGATVAGLDASAGLLDVAATRVPEAELVCGSMFDLPWGDESFDVVTSFNGIWGGCEDAVVEITRVLRPGGHLAFSFWGPGRELDLRDYFFVLGTTGPDVAEELMSLAHVGAPGVAEQMVAEAGLELVAREKTAAQFEWADEDAAWRALRSPGVALPSLEATGESELRRRVLEAIAPFRSEAGTYHATNSLEHVIARKP